MSADSVKKNIDRDQRIMHRTGSLHKYLPTESRAFIPESQSARYLAHNQSIESHDCNPIYEVSNEFMKVQGYGPQFQNFLKSPRRRSEFADLQSLTVDDGRGVGMPENGPLTVTRLANGQLVTCAKEPEVVVDAFSHRQHSLEIKREHSKRRLLRGSDEVKREFQQARQRLCVRKRMFWQRAFLCRMSIAMATIGILLMVIDSELCAANYFDKFSWQSLLLRVFVLITTIMLIGFIWGYHIAKVKLIALDHGTEDWSVAISTGLVAEVVAETFICAICPLPGSGYMQWPVIVFNDTINSRKVEYVDYPVDTMLSVPMILRVYLVGRYMVIHSKLFQDAATRSIAALNNVNVDFKFVLKTMMMEDPLRVLVTFTICYWIAAAWMLTLCERYAEVLYPEDYNYLNSLWFIIITFLSIGYGDFVPHTYCGRSLAISTGIMGIGVASALIAVISRKLELSKAEKHVNAFLADTKLTRKRKDAAASVLQQTWFIYKFRNLRNIDDLRIRAHQRKFLIAINNFRRVKWEQRRLTEQSNMLVDIAKVQSSLQSSMHDTQLSQKRLISMVETLNDKICEMQRSQDHRVSRGVTTNSNSVRLQVPGMASLEDDLSTGKIEKAFIGTHSVSFPCSRTDTVESNDF